MPVLTANHALVAAAGALALTLYDRGVFQGAWNALRGADVPLKFSLPTSSDGTDHQFLGPPDTKPPGAGGFDFTAAGNKVVAEGPPDGTKDWFDWCLNWVNRTRAALGRGNAALSDPTAAAACGELDLQPGIAPRGSIVCFRPTAANPDGHIGLSNGNNTYASTGITHGGISVLDYLGNPNYWGWAP
jgi:hypothetical protein